MITVLVCQLLSGVGTAVMLTAVARRVDGQGRPAVWG